MDIKADTCFSVFGSSELGDRSWRGEHPQVNGQLPHQAEAEAGDEGRCLGTSLVTFGSMPP